MFKIKEDFDLEHLTVYGFKSDFKDIWYLKCKNINSSRDDEFKDYDLMILVNTAFKKDNSIYIYMSVDGYQDDGFLDDPFLDELFLIPKELFDLYKDGIVIWKEDE
ncbi:MAG: hypothetical protein ACOC1K_05345 [Nanoarchaeota archaeon]